MTNAPATARPFFRALAIAGAALLAGAAIDTAAIWFGLTPPVGCAVLPLVQILALVAGLVLALIGVVIWIFSRFKSREGLYLVAGALGIAIVPAPLIFLFWVIGTGCGD